MTDFGFFVTGMFVGMTLLKLLQIVFAVFDDDHAERGD